MTTGTPQTMTSAAEPEPGWADLYRSGRFGITVLIAFGVWLHAADELMVSTITPAMLADIGGGKGKNKKPSRPRNPYLFKKLEASIIALEEERETLQGELAGEDVYKDPDAMRERQYRLAEIERDLEDKNREWEEWV